MVCYKQMRNPLCNQLASCFASFEECMFVPRVSNRNRGAGRISDFAIRAKQGANLIIVATMPNMPIHCYSLEK